MRHMLVRAGLALSALIMSMAASSCGPGEQMLMVDVEWQRSSGGEIGFLIGRSQAVDPSSPDFGHTVIEAIGGGGAGVDWVALARAQDLRVGDALNLVHGRDVARRGLVRCDASRLFGATHSGASQ